MPESIDCPTCGQSVNPDMTMYDEIKRGSMPDASHTTLTTGTCDERIGHYRHAIKKAERGDGKANIAVCQMMLDKWLEARRTATPGPRQRGKELA